MASANPDILYKFESMRTKWTRCFEEDKPDIAKTVRHFFGRQFYRKHKHSTYVIGELPDGIFLFVKPTMYEGGVRGVQKPQNRTEIRQKTTNRIGFFPEFRNRA